ncbi:hypothetical protein NP493_481g01007 [Ridgeia piscesae]|uniref:Protein Wnt n=1 Tax=Ridgeia piscesae TaxID=27915 RepID=A0AAD9KYB0_RIDPI|nr:hypothetical protein NP493_481g01007 [Ridgeia piscesae]
MRTVQKGMRRTCKCHGVSGSCTVKTCWRQLLPFHLTATQLKQKYNKSVKVVMSTNSATGKRQLIKLRRRRKQTALHAPSRKDLVYIEKSPNYCKRSAFSLGTRGRVCDKQSNCDVMCCGRGYNVMTKQVTTPCRCRHVWCCYVKCETCVQNIDVYTCK